MLASVVLSRLTGPLRDARTLLGAGVVRPERPDRLVRAGLALLAYGPSLGAGLAAGAARSPRRTAVVDEAGPLSWRDLDLRSNALAHAARTLGARPGSALAVLCRNGRGFLIATGGISKTGGDTVLLNTALAPDQLMAAVALEGVLAVVADDDLLETASGLGVPAYPVSALADGPTQAPEPPGRAGRLVVLTSGTTGVPRGAGRKGVADVEAFLALIEGLGLRGRAVHVVAAPLFHAWGLAGLGLSFALGATSVLRARFDAEAVLADVAGNRAEVLWAVPVMLQRLLALPDEVTARYDTTSLRVVAVSGSALPGGLAAAWTQRFGPSLHSVYGSTEVGWATVAAPTDLLADPRTAGRPARGVRLRVVDERGTEVPAGHTGQVYVGSKLTFEGYTGGADKHRLDGLVATGDLGHLDPDGRLTIDGREDDMVITGGENVFPRSVEDVLAGHPAVGEVAVVGVPDEDLGQRLVAYVALAGDHPLDGEDLRAWARPLLARYALPRRVVVVDALPRNATGKVVTRDLPSPN